jgi:hypothetical protein
MTTHQKLEEAREIVANCKSCDDFRESEFYPGHFRCVNERVCNCLLAAADVLALAAPQWMPISTAPKDGTRVLLLLPDNSISVGFWHDDKYAKKPRPFWRYDAWDHMVSICRAFQPTRWLPLPKPPPQTEGE